MATGDQVNLKSFSPQMMAMVTKFIPAYILRAYNNIIANTGILDIQIFALLSLEIVKHFMIITIIPDLSKTQYLQGMRKFDSSFDSISIEGEIVEEMPRHLQFIVSPPEK